MMDREMEERIPMPEIGSAVFECESVEEAREKAAELWGIKADDIEAR
jgi:spoIIIJ-associated protein